MGVIENSKCNKQPRYDDLVAARKACRRCHDVVNPSLCEAGKFDQDGHIGAWSNWQGNLDADLMVIGQEWGGTSNYAAQCGRDLDDDPTNKNLRTLLMGIGRPVLPPNKLQMTAHTGNLFFTNGVLCLRKGASTSSEQEKKEKNDISVGSFLKCGQTFLRPQIELIRPRTILVLGKLPWNGLLKAFGLAANLSHTKSVDGDPVRLNNHTVAIPLFHCGARSTNMNRDLPTQQTDWARARRVIERIP